MRNPYSHVDLRVREMAKTLPFYERLLPALGFTRTRHDPTWKVFAAPGNLPSVPFFSITEEANHQANANRVAFWAGSREVVDRIGALLRELDARIESGPRECPEYGGQYYAVFFRDPSGNLLEVVYRML